MQRRFAPTAFLPLVGVLLPSLDTVRTFGGEVVRDCDMQLSVEGLHPLASALRDAPRIQARILGSHLVEGGQERRAVFRVE